MSILSLQNISFAYDKTPVLQNISYEFEKGKMYCIIGKSGAGKTTLLSLLSGLAKPTGGEIFYDDKNVAKLININFALNISVLYFKVLICLPNIQPLRTLFCQWMLRDIKLKAKNREP